MRETPEILASHLIDCHDTEGRPVRVGAGATNDGRVILLMPAAGTPQLNQDQALAFGQCVRRAISDAATQQ